MDLSLWLFVAVKRPWSREQRSSDKVPWGGSSWGSHVGKFPIISTISGNEPSIQELSELVELVSLVGRMRQHKQDQKGSRGHTVTKVKSNTAKGRGGGNQWKKLQLPPAGCIRRPSVGSLDHLPVTK